MLVSEYVLQVIEKRPYKYSTKLTNVADVKRLGIWDMDTSAIHHILIHGPLVHRRALPCIEQLGLAHSCLAAI